VATAKNLSAKSIKRRLASVIPKRVYVFDTFQCIKELIKAGFQQEQAEAQVKLMGELVNQTLCTREDLEKSEERLTLKTEDVREDLEKSEERLTLKIEDARKELKIEIEVLRKELKVSEERLTLKIEDVRKELKVEMEVLRKELALHIVQAKHEMVKWLIGMSVANLGLIFTMFKFLV
jgi:hypothetical protein